MDYERDPNLSEEVGSAKIFSVYISEAEKYDKTLVNSWRNDMEGMLIFAGLFSAVLTAFLVESYKTLIPDSGDLTVELLLQISHQFAAGLNGTSFDLPSRAVFVAPSSSLVCNTFWFISLGLSLASALLATLVEQWARNFSQKVDMRPSPIIRARVFSYLYHGLKQFNMHNMVDIVPLFLHFSLIFFFAGLVAFLLPINRTVTIVAVLLLGIVTAVYIGATVLPLLYSNCPYRTPLTSVCWRLSQLIRMSLTRRWSPTNLSILQNETLVEVMVYDATRESKERTKRDIHALLWTIRSLTDDDELAPFIEGIPGALWSPDGRRFVHEPLIFTLLDDPEVRLDHRLGDFLRGCESGLLDPNVKLHRQVSCLKAIWALAGLATTSPLDESFRQPLRDFDASVLYVEDNELAPYWISAQAVLGWTFFCDFSVALERARLLLISWQAALTSGPLHMELIRDELLPLRLSAQKYFEFCELDAQFSPQLDAPLLALFDGASSISNTLHQALSLVTSAQNEMADAVCNLLSTYLIRCAHIPSPAFEFDLTCDILAVENVPAGKTLELLCTRFGVVAAANTTSGESGTRIDEIIAVILSLCIWGLSSSEDIPREPVLQHLLALLAARDSAPVTRAIISHVDTSLLSVMLQEFLKNLVAPDTRSFPRHEAEEMLSGMWEIAAASNTFTDEDILIILAQVRDTSVAGSLASVITPKIFVPHLQALETTPDSQLDLQYLMQFTSLPMLPETSAAQATPDVNMLDLDNDEAQRQAHCVALRDIMKIRLHETIFVSAAAFFEACAGPVHPYKAVDTVLLLFPHTMHFTYPVHPDHQLRLAMALKKIADPPLEFDQGIQARDQEIRDSILCDHTLPALLPRPACGGTGARRRDACRIYA
ncbi:hypothetical protein MVEN_01463400 [Mycena venus]|uniref:DUF6535 domain-containing protein n=1 Tax=Mycena venus TaxID=2733690 RepID=A0A8H7CR23_9AGAR|nr:hypothetical protein MVEN_01463400 [Mycena venus]